MTRDKDPAELKAMDSRPQERWTEPKHFSFLPGNTDISPTMIDIEDSQEAPLHSGTVDTDRERSPRRQANGSEEDKGKRFARQPDDVLLDK